MKIAGYTIFEKQPQAEKPAPEWHRAESGPRTQTETQVKEDTGAVDTNPSRWTDKAPHPTYMAKYRELNRDAEVGTAIDALANMRCGSGFYTEMSEDVQANPEDTHPSKEKVDEWCESVNLDELIVAIERERIGMGICPVERLSRNEAPKLLPPDSFYIYRKPTGEVYKYTQETSAGRNLATWEKNELSSLVLFKKDEDPAHPYGKALCADIKENIDMRRQMNKDVPTVIHKFAYPLRVSWANRKEVMDVYYNALVSRNPDEEIMLDNVMKDEFGIITDTIPPRTNFADLIENNDMQIAEHLHAPLLLWLRNATEASANTILDVINIDNQAAQRYLKRRVERFFFKPLVGEPVPRLVFGSPKSGLEDVTLGEVTDAFAKGVFTFPQVQDLMRKLGLPIVEAPKPDVAPGIAPDSVPPELQTQLDTLEQSYRLRKITLTEALREGNACIDGSVDLMRTEAVKRLQASGVKVEALDPSSEQYYLNLHGVVYNAYKERILPTGAPPEKKPSKFRVEVLE